MDNKNSFEEFYEAELVPEITKMEILRKDFKKKFSIYLAFLGFILLILFSSTLVEQQSELVNSIFSIIFLVAIFAFFTILIVLIVKYYSFRKKFIPKYKEDVIKTIIQYINDELKYDAKSKFPRDQYLKSKLFHQRPDRYYGEDYVEGKIGDTFCRFSELHTQFKTRSGKDNKESWHTIFRGIFFEADFNKQFKTNTFILPDYLERSLGFIGKKLQSLNFTRPPIVKLEDPEFEKHFVVYGEDQVEARYILSTSLMKRLTEFREKRKHPVAISFVNNSIFVAITEHKNLFEPRIFRTNLNMEVLEEYYSMLDLVIGIVDDLNLNNRIWAGSKMKTEL
ncbi:hypothetical protein MATR_23330 [Marivirga tractuosa]|uniref:Galanin n=1 Tax=Marivirga tractuosa (strain ATCC 23168 / DSM 4126 / NBRC 15989 / NCIMB 1408 / VKM B-1430 / H-43) TaxID=643867 RepID=E4TUT2_MARTH|nr:DUF3137 domain-containing protein [Marivirga tractuosa]ADR20060.1 galanin [Marivirga tractuosa DSM 4126]BDD15508.1 hypothetical protein MATR_23330 [Marivirga tractuosa]